MKIEEIVDRVKKVICFKYISLKREKYLDFPILLFLKTTAQS
jgi:hypothetical protein